MSERQDYQWKTQAINQILTPNTPNTGKTWNAVKEIGLMVLLVAGCAALLTIVAGVIVILNATIQVLNAD